MPDFDQLFYNDGNKIAERFVSDDFNLSTLNKLCIEAYASIDELIVLFQNQCKSQNQIVSCIKGCAYCCYQCVHILPHELFYLFFYLKSNFSKKVINEIQFNTKEKYNSIRNMKAEEYIYFKYPCPFLKDNVCIIYNARPLACRTFLSSSINSCEKELHNPKDLNNYPALYDFPLKAGRMLNKGIFDAFANHSFSQVEIRLGLGLNVMFENENIFNDWLSKKDVFKDFRLNEEDKKYLERFE